MGTGRLQRSLHSAEKPSMGESTFQDLRELTGVIPPMITPFSDDDCIDRDLLQQETRYLLESGIDGIVVGGSTGEGAGMPAGRIV